jgi:Fatty acid hydroxylase superfamily
MSNLHSSYFHSIRSPWAFVAQYDHPLPYILWRLLPLYLPAIAFRMHLLTYLLLLAQVSLEESLTLSGYTTIPGIVLGGFARRQDLHSESRGKGNFSPWGLMDWIFGTSIGADVVDDMKGEAEKHQVAERSGRAWNNAKESGKSRSASMEYKEKIFEESVSHCHCQRCITGLC